MAHGCWLAHTYAGPPLSALAASAALLRRALRAARWQVVVQREALYVAGGVARATEPLVAAPELTHFSDVCLGPCDCWVATRRLSHAAFVMCR